MKKRSFYILGNLAIIIGSLLPWYVLSSQFGTTWLNGIEGDKGVSTLVLGILSLLISLIVRKTRLIRLVTIGTFTSIVVIMAIRTSISLMALAIQQSSEQFTTHIGVGLPTILAGCVFVSIALLADFKIYDLDNL